MKIRHGWVLAAGVVAAAVPATARACETSGLQQGLNVPYPPEVRPLYSDGVLGFDAYALAATPEEALAQFRVEVLRGEEAVAGDLEIIQLWSGTYDVGDVVYAGLPVHQFVIVWRPQAPLLAGSYTGTATIATMFESTWEIPLMLEVTDGAGPAVAAPDGEVGIAEQIVEAYERACCESTPTSCGYSPACKPTEVRYGSMFTLRTELAEAAAKERAYLWVAPYVDGEAGAPVPTHTPYYDAFSGPLWAQWSQDFSFGGDGEQCVVLGATSLIDGSTAVSQPQCRTVPPERDESLTPEFLPLDVAAGMGDCVSPPVYEHSGEPYGEPAADQDGDGGAGGCRTTAAGPWGLVVVAGLRRRRRP